jgi:hypothetical protein
MASLGWKGLTYLSGPPVKEPSPEALCSETLHAMKYLMIYANVNNI